MSKAGFGLSSGLVGLLAVLADRRFDAVEKGIGFLLAARGAGIVLGPFIARRVAADGHQSCTDRVWSLGIGERNDVLLRAPRTDAVARRRVRFGAHLGGGTQWTLSSYGLQVSTPDELRGRIFATDLALVTLTMTISLVVAGVASNQFGPRPVMSVLAVVNLIWGATYLWFTTPSPARGRQRWERLSPMVTRHLPPKLLRHP